MHHDQRVDHIDRCHAANTRRVEGSFLWQHGSPLAMALLVATVGGILAVLALGPARITQLRRLARARRR
jgi:uncharacterized integral membrane protein